MRLNQWDNEIGPYLRSALEHARWLSYHARRMVGAVQILPARPVWPTACGEALELAERELAFALEMAREARRMLDNKPIIPEETTRDEEIELLSI